MVGVAVGPVVGVAAGAAVGETVGAVVGIDVGSKVLAILCVPLSHAVSTAKAIKHPTPPRNTYSMPFTTSRRS